MLNVKSQIKPNTVPYLTLSRYNLIAPNSKYRQFEFHVPPKYGVTRHAKLALVSVSQKYYQIA